MSRLWNKRWNKERNLEKLSMNLGKKSTGLSYDLRLSERKWLCRVLCKILNKWSTHKRQRYWERLVDWRRFVESTSTNWDNSKQKSRQFKICLRKILKYCRETSRSILPLLSSRENKLSKMLNQLPWPPASKTSRSRSTSNPFSLLERNCVKDDMNLHDHKESLLLIYSVFISLNPISSVEVGLLMALRLVILKISRVRPGE